MGKDISRARIYTGTSEQTVVPDEGGTLKRRKWPHCEKISLSRLNCLSQRQPLKVSSLKNNC